MNTSSLTVLAALGVCVLNFAQAPVVTAQAGHSHGLSANIAVPDTAAGIVDEIKKQHAALTAAVTGKNLKAVHDLAETMTALARALPGKVAEEKKASVQGSANNMTKLLDTLHHAADDGDQPRAGIELKKLDGVVKSLDKHLQ